MTSALDLELRTYFRTLDAALADFALPLGAVDKVRDVTRGLRYEHIYIPESRSYIALEPLGAEKPVAYITSVYVALHPQDGESQWIELPGAVADGPLSGSGDTPAAAAAPAKPVKPAEPVILTCSSCFTNLPATGVCDYC
ncbi:hypothetical protein ON058_04695 [Demequina sp. B12]|uniref:hypothetical protein n=1 Tax=Demequina sp. B12 TaxID=2992757 RepID=UPI00237A9821|nr:hypothetical protein [Demequina sp. B12]MDE0572712.1 hypothetical protein [Demequina sp. B12]